MTKKFVRLVIILVIAQLSACASIHFENGSVIPDPEPFSITFGLFEDDKIRALDASTSIRFRKWYHHGLYQLAEISNPLEITEVCTGLAWNQITTEVTPFDVIAGLLDNALFYTASSMGIDLWSPWSIQYSCRHHRSL